MKSFSPWDFSPLDTTLPLDGSREATECCNFSDFACLRGPHNSKQFDPVSVPLDLPDAFVLSYVCMGDGQNGVMGWERRPHSEA